MARRPDRLRRRPPGRQGPPERIPEPEDEREGDDDALSAAPDDSDGAERAHDEETAAKLGPLLRDATQYIDEDVAPDREAATGYYRGDPLGDEEEGRSQVVMTEVRDTVQAIMPSLLRIFAGAEKVIEYTPTTEEDVPFAEQATDYIHYVFMTENHGFMRLFAVFKDALIRKTGILTWYVEDRRRVREYEYSDLTEEEISILEADDGVEILEREEQLTEVPEITEQGTIAPVQLWTVRVRRTTKDKRIIVDALPPEEFFFSRDATCEDDADVIGRRRDLTLTQLVGMGYDRDEVAAHMGSDHSLDFNTERQERNPAIIHGTTDVKDDGEQKALYFDVIATIDGERRRIRGIGLSSPYILRNEPWPEDEPVPYAVLCPDPEPHMLVGYSIADQTADLQEIKTRVVRNTLDSLAQSIHPRTVVVEGQVNIDDALNTEVGAIIRARAPGMVQALDMPFVGQYSLPLIAYLDRIRAQRTGITEASQGLDADVLQSTTKAAVTATVSAAQERIEMIARIFAETGLVRLFRGLLKLAVQHSDKPRVFRLRKKWVTVDPRQWDADMDATPNVGLGRGTEQDKLQLYMAVAQKQEQIIVQAGPGNPICGLAELRNTYAKILEIGGERDVSRYFKPIDPNAPPAQQPQQQGDPATQALAQAEMAKAQVQAQAEAAKDQRERLKLSLEDAREREKLAQERMLKIAEINARYQTQIDLASINAQIERERAQSEAIAGLEDSEAARAHEAEQAEIERWFRAQAADADRAAQTERERERARAASRNEGGGGGARR